MAQFEPNPYMAKHTADFFIVLFLYHHARVYT